jgi:hypothetical protein
MDINSAASSPSHSGHQRWDGSGEWESLCYDSETNCFVKESETWGDLTSSSHWEESKSKDAFATEDLKYTDDVARFEENEIIDSWLNEEILEGNTATQPVEATETNASETDMGERRSSPYPSSPVLTDIVSNLPKILITRDMLERWLGEPYFDRLVQGCFVRVKIGEYVGSPVYRIAHIEDVVDGCYMSYPLTRGNTTKGLSLQLGGSFTRTFPIIAISNDSPSESDLRNWQEEMEKNNVLFDPIEVKQKEEIVRVLHIKYPSPSSSSSSSSYDMETSEPFVREPTIWASC